MDPMMNHGGYGHTGMQPMDAAMDIGDANMNFEVNPAMQGNQPQQGQQGPMQGQMGNW